MTCRSWLEGSCDCGQPCDDDNSNTVETVAPVIVSSANMVEIKKQFKVLADVYSKNYPMHIVWEHLELVAKLLNVEISSKS